MYEINISSWDETPLTKLMSSHAQHILSFPSSLNLPYLKEVPHRCGEKLYRFPDLHSFFVHHVGSKWRQTRIESSAHMLQDMVRDLCHDDLHTTAKHCYWARPLHSTACMRARHYSVRAVYDETQCRGCTCLIPSNHALMERK